MVKSETLVNWQAEGQKGLAALEEFGREHRLLLQTVGIVAVAAATGAVVGVVVVKSGLAFNAVLAAKSVTPSVALPAVVKSSLVAKPLAATALPATATSGASATAVLNTLATNGTAALNNAAGLVNSVTTTGATISTQLTSLFNLLSQNAIPLTAGAVGGGAVGAGVVKRQVRDVEERLNEQVAQTEAYQTEATRLQAALATAEAKITDVPATVIPPAPAVVAPAPAVPDSLEEIRGIGLVFARRLNEAGIVTFADLAAKTADQVREILGARSVARFNVQDWIDQAQQRVASRQPLSTTLAAPDVSTPAPAPSDPATPATPPEES